MKGWFTQVSHPFIHYNYLLCLIIYSIGGV